MARIPELHPAVREDRQYLTIPEWKEQEAQRVQETARRGLQALGDVTVTTPEPVSGGDEEAADIANDTNDVDDMDDGEGVDEREETRSTGNLEEAPEGDDEESNVFLPVHLAPEVQRQLGDKLVTSLRLYLDPQGYVRWTVREAWPETGDGKTKKLAK